MSGFYPPLPNRFKVYQVSIGHYIIVDEETETMVQDNIKSGKDARYLCRLKNIAVQ